MHRGGRGGCARVPTDRKSVLLLPWDCVLGAEEASDRHGATERFVFFCNLGDASCGGWTGPAEYGDTTAAPSGGAKSIQKHCHKISHGVVFIIFIVILVKKKKKEKKRSSREKNGYNIENMLY